MKTKQEFLDAQIAELSNYPISAQLYQAGDPRLLSMLNAMAAMLAMASAEQDVAAGEPFTKSRDVTVLADAAVKGIIPFARPTKVTIAVENGSTRPLQITAGRGMMDTQGRSYKVETGTTIGVGLSGTITAIQYGEKTITHTVTENKPFYRIDVPSPESGFFISSVRLIDESGFEYPYTPEYVNVAAGQKMFHLETDENRALYVQFGAGDVGGYQPSTGEVYTLIVQETEGEITLQSDAIFAFEYSTSLYERGAKLTLDSVVTAGAGPIDIETLRKIASYPSIYDASAVYLGNFDFLIRRNIYPLKFLSVWNEQEEERVRGASVDNINTLFVTALSDAFSQAELNAKIEKVIKTADDSYRIKHVARVAKEISVTIAARCSEVYDFTALEQQIADEVIKAYGIDSDFAKYGRGRVLYKKLYSLLTSKFQALQGDGSDLEITIDDPEANIMPEDHRYVSLASLTVEVGAYHGA